MCYPFLITCCRGGKFQAETPFPISAACLPHSYRRFSNRKSGITSQSATLPHFSCGLPIPPMVACWFVSGGIERRVPCGASYAALQGVSGWLLAVRLWNCSWWEPFGESRSRRCAARRPPESPRILNFLRSTFTGISASALFCRNRVCRPVSSLRRYCWWRGC